MANGVTASQCEPMKICTEIGSGMPFWLPPWPPPLTRGLGARAGGVVHRRVEARPEELRTPRLPADSNPSTLG